MDWRDFARFIAPTFLVVLLVSIGIGSFLPDALFGFVIAFIFLWSQITKYAKIKGLEIPTWYVIFIDLVLSVLVYTLTMAIAGIWNPIIR